MLGDVNIKSENYINDKTTIEGATIKFVSLQYGPNQIINKQTHILDVFHLVIISYLHHNQT